MLVLAAVAGCGGDDDDDSMMMPAMPDTGPREDAGPPARDAARPDADAALSPEAQTRADIEAFLMGEHTAHDYPAFAVGVFDEDGVVASWGFGRRDRRNDMPVDEHTVFRIGSITKPITALTALSIRDEGLIALDDHVSATFPELMAELEPEGMPPVLIRHLLNHSSGIPRDGNEMALPGVITDRELTIDDVIANQRGTMLMFAPGAEFSYSNQGYALLGGIIARKDGGAYAASARRRVLDPLGMAETYFDFPEVPDDALARGNFLNVGGYEAGDESLRFGAFASEGAIFSTVSDMAKLGGFILRTLVHEDAPMGPVARATLVEATTTTLEIDDGYGIGHSFFLIDDPRLGPLVEHAGSTLDYGAELFVAPEAGLGVVALLATGDGVPLECLAYGTLSRFHDGPLPPNGCKPYVFPGADAALRTYRELIATPDRARIEASFTPDFLAEVPVAEMEEIFGQVRMAAGECTSHEVIASSDTNGNLARVHCANGDLQVLIFVEEAEPHRIQGLLLTDAS